MAFLMPEMTVEVYNADYRVLSRIPWQEAVRLILRGAVYVIDVHRPAVHVHSPSLAIELPVSVALREYVHLHLLRRTCRNGGSRAASLPRRRAHLVQSGCGVPTLQRSQGGPDSAGGREDHDPRAFRAEGPRPVPVRPVTTAIVNGGCERAGLQQIPNRGRRQFPSARTGALIPRSVNR